MAYHIELDRAERGRIVVLLTTEINQLAAQLGRISGPGEVHDTIRGELDKAKALRDRIGALEWVEPTEDERLAAIFGRI
jgi:hypothetical protein